jgi:hypothetical protein
MHRNKQHRSPDGVSLPEGSQDLDSLQSDPTSYPFRTATYFRAVKWLRRKSDHSLSSRVELQIFKSCCLLTGTPLPFLYCIKHRWCLISTPAVYWRITKLDSLYSGSRQSMVFRGFSKYLKMQGY